MKVEKGTRKKPIWLETPFLMGVLLTVVVFVAFGYALFCMPVIQSDGSYLNKWSYLKEAAPNEIGDTLAGVAGSLAFVWLVVTVWLQAKELREQRGEFETMNDIMGAQKFESMIFEFIRAHNEIANGIEIDRPDFERPLRGRACFPFLYNELSREYRERLKKHSERVALYYAYKNLWNTYGNLLGHYYRNLYNTFRVISDSRLKENYHAKLVRAQLSDHELLLLFYNCNSPQGGNFKKYAIEFSLFDNLPSIQVLDHSHYDILPDAFGANPLLTPAEMRVSEKEHIQSLEQAT